MPKICGGCLGFASAKRHSVKFSDVKADLIEKGCDVSGISDEEMISFVFCSVCKKVTITSHNL